MLLSSKYEVVRVEDRDVRVFPMRLRTAFKLRVVLIPVVEALALAFRNTDAIDVSVEEMSRVGDGGSAVGTQRIISAITPELARVRHEQASSAIRGAVESLLSPESEQVVAEILSDALREEAKAGGGSILDQIDLPTAGALLGAVYRANKSVLDPFLSALPAKLRSKAAEGAAVADPAQAQ